MASTEPYDNQQQSQIILLIILWYTYPQVN